MFRAIRSLLLASVLCLVSCFMAASAFAATLSNRIGYYGDDFYRDVSSGKKDKDMITVIRTVLESKHMRTRSGVDTVGVTCDSAALSCYEHKAIGYSAARKVLMGTLSLKGTAGSYILHDVYCEKDFTSVELGAGIGPGKIPSDSVVNTEHTWPQSRFNRSMGKEVQKSDLHHLYATDSQMNSARGNFKFGDVAVPEKTLKCPQVKLGTAAGGSEEIFEPPVGHKGNVARALFYFSIRYHLAIDPREEAFLKAWNRLDPVDQAERDRNDAIYKIQGNRNPFVDYPELADEIADF